MKSEPQILPFMFVARCSGAATIAYLAANWIGLHHPIWPVMSALVISQERFEDTKSSLISFIAGTFVGICSAAITNAVGSYCGADIVMQIAAGVALCAVVAQQKPRLRVCMWTCSLVLLTTSAFNSVTVVALDRGSEVLLGAFIGAGLHWVLESRLLPNGTHHPKPTLSDPYPRPVDSRGQ
jgi:uncharacterized membrane protein YccC